MRHERFEIILEPLFYAVLFGRVDVLPLTECGGDEGIEVCWQASGVVPFTFADLAIVKLRDRLIDFGSIDIGHAPSPLLFADVGTESLDAREA